MKWMVTKKTIHSAYALLGCEEYNAICSNCHAHHEFFNTFPLKLWHSEVFVETTIQEYLASSIFMHFFLNLMIA